MNSKKHIRLTNASLATMVVAIGIMFSRIGLETSSANDPNQLQCDVSIDMRQNCTIPITGGTYVSTYLGPVYPSCAETGGNDHMFEQCCQYEAQRKLCVWDTTDFETMQPVRATFDSGYIANLEQSTLWEVCFQGTCRPE